MKKICDLCGIPVGLFKFRYAEGYVCKTCYKAASKNFTETIREKTFDEISKLCEYEKNATLIGEDFEITAKIGNFILIDNRRKKFYIVNRNINSDNKKYTIYSFADVKSYEISTDPKLTLTELKESANNSSLVIKSMSIKLSFYSTQKEENIVIISTPVRIKSRAFKLSFDFALRILGEFEKKHKAI
jgi:hypothetical protein